TLNLIFKVKRGKGYEIKSDRSVVVIHQSRLFENNFCSWLYSKVVCHTTDRGSRRRASRRYGRKPSDFYHLIIVRQDLSILRRLSRWMSSLDQW
ncbi:hypothetical protein G9C98_004191, partial [Cotesia typhae]